MAGAAKREVAESSFDFLHYSIVNTVSRWARIRLRGRATDTSCINIESVFEQELVFIAIRIRLGGQGGQQIHPV
jgi:hypothetical protein